MSSSNNYSSSSSSLPQLMVDDDSKCKADKPHSAAFQCASSPPPSPSTIDNDHRISRRIVSNNGIIELNVGGTIHTTTLSTLNRVPGSFFEAMFSGRHRVPNCARTDVRVYSAAPDTSRSSPLSYFIDRDGKHFRHILNYLRCGTVVSLPRDDISKVSALNSKQNRHASF